MKRIILLSLIMLALAGCAINSRYINYTDQKYQPKQKYYYITVYESQPALSTQPFQVIGRVETSGYINSGVTSESLSDQAKKIARVRGADAIINAKTEQLTFNGVDVIPGYRGRHHYRPDEYVMYSETLLRFRGELIVFLPAVIPENK
jgi:hypothetical protein